MTSLILKALKVFSFSFFFFSFFLYCVFCYLLTMMLPWRIITCNGGGGGDLTG